jgi:hypothetical protein
MGILAEIQASRAVGNLSDALRKFCQEGEELLAHANQEDLRFALAELGNVAEVVQAAQSLQYRRRPRLVDETDAADLEHAPGGCGETLFSGEVVGDSTHVLNVDPYYKPLEVPVFNQ